MSLTANLGLATTGELIEELRARFEVHTLGLGYRGETHTTTGNALDMLAQRFDKQCPDGLNYSTVGDDLYETAVRSL